MVLRSLDVLFTLLCKNAAMLARHTKHIHVIGLQKKKYGTDPRNRSRHRSPSKISISPVKLVTRTPRIRNRVVIIQQRVAGNRANKLY